MRLAIDARMLDNSGVGVYLSRVLPGVVERCASLHPLVLATPGSQDRVRGLVDGLAECRTWTAPPLSLRELFPPPGAGRGTLLWVPHYNVPLLSRTPLVVTLHDVLPLSSAAGHWPLPKRLAVRAWLAAIRSRAMRVICSSEFTRSEAVRLANIDPARMVVVPLGVDPVIRAAGAARQDAAAPYLLFVGLVKPHKNLSGLLSAFKSIANAIPHRLIIVGRHKGLRDVDSAALSLAASLAPRVELLESVPQVRLAELVAGAAILVQPSFYEGFGLPPLEAMAAGTPVIASTSGSLPEVCGDAAVYIDPSSPEDIARRIREVLGDETLRERMRTRGLARAAHFTWEACVARTSEILLEACASSSRIARNEGTP